MSVWKLLNFIFQILSLCSDGQIFKGVPNQQHHSWRLDVSALSINLGKGCQQQFLLVFLITLFKVEKCQEEHSNKTSESSARVPKAVEKQQTPRVKNLFVKIYLFIMKFYVCLIFKVIFIESCCVTFPRLLLVFFSNVCPIQAGCC